MGLFKGFNQADLLERNPRFLCAVLAEQLTLTNKALEAVSEELKQVKKDKATLSINDLSNHSHADAFAAGSHQHSMFRYADANHTHSGSTCENPKE